MVVATHVGQDAAGWGMLAPRGIVRHGAVTTSGLRCGLLAGIVTLTSLARGEDTPPQDPATENVEVSREHAQSWFEEGQAAYARGEFEIAAALFRAVYVATPAPAILYDLAQAERKAKQCKAALAHYEEYVKLEQAAAPNDIDQKIAEVRSCAATEKEESAPRMKPDKGHSSRAKATPPRKPEGRDHSTQHALGYGLIGGAVLTAAFGTVFLIHANSASKHLEELSASGGQWGDRYESYQTELNLNRAAAIGFFVTSGVMAAAGTTILLVKWPGDTASVAVGAKGSGLGATYTVRF